ncbi:MAG TPA: Ku protein [Planctomycetota bacterium]|nr:Ku protein [Planctomycetota bacterium]
MARAIWKGSISFGLVDIPVGLVSAEEPKETKLSYLDRRDFAPVGYKRYNKATEEEVAWDDVVRGFEYEKGEYVVLSEEELKRASPEKTQTVEILHFVDGSEIEPISYDRPYYLEPLKRKGKGYALLRETLRRTGRVGIAKVVIRTREHLAALSVRGDALALYLLRYADEIRPVEELANVDVTLKDVGVSDKEVEMATKLVEGMVEEWDPVRYEDEYAGDLMKLVERKVSAGQMHEIPRVGREEEPAPRGEVIDLMPLLKKSLERSRPAARKAAKAPAKKRATRRNAPSRRSA